VARESGGRASPIVILETIVTSVAEDGTVNCAPMGVEWGEDTIILKPFLETTTYRNLVATRAAVVNLIDDVRVFARSAISKGKMLKLSTAGRAATTVGCPRSQRSW
jgi:hypothetical protein